MFTNENVFGALTMAFAWLCIVAIMPITPYLTRKTECFGVSIPEAEYKNPFFQKVRKGYALSTVLIGLIFAACSVASTLFWGEKAIVVGVAPIFIYIGINFIIYYMGHKKVKAFKQTQNWEQKTVAVAEITPRKENIVKNVSPWLLLIYPLMVILTVVLTIIFYDQAPNRIAMHYNFAGNVTQYVDKSWAKLMFMPFMQVFLSALFGLIYLVIRTSKKQINAENPEDSLWRTLTFRRIISMAIFIMGILLIGLFGIIQMNMLGLIASSVMVYLPIAVLVVVIGGTLYVSIKVGQGGSRLKRAAAEPHKVFVQEDDKYWKLGCLYFNPDDPSLFVEKRFGIGWTSNFARPATYVIIIAFIAVMAGIVFVSHAVSK